MSSLVLYFFNSSSDYKNYDQQANETCFNVVFEIRDLVSKEFSERLIHLLLCFSIYLIQDKGIIILLSFL